MDCFVKAVRMPEPNGLFSRHGGVNNPPDDAEEDDRKKEQD
jgi:hypothetical protein